MLDIQLLRSNTAAVAERLAHAVTSLIPRVLMLWKSNAKPFK